MLAILEEQREWLQDILERAHTWQPSFGDIAIITEEVRRAEILLHEAGSHDSSMQYLVDSKTFVVDHSLVVDRPWADEAIMVSREEEREVEEEEEGERGEEEGERGVGGGRARGRGRGER